MARDSVQHGSALPLAPLGGEHCNTAFSHCSVIITDKQSSSRRHAFEHHPIVPYHQLDAYLLHHHGHAIQEQGRALIDKLTSPRPHPFPEMKADAPLIMGIVNVTPDSFSDGGLYVLKEHAITHALALHKAGAHIIDIGGESTRPQARIVPIEEEQQRVIPVIKALAAKHITMSIDSRNAQTIDSALAHGASLINDVSALRHDAKSMDVAQRHAHAPIILMHMQGTPQTMQDHPSYDCVVLDVYDALQERIHMCEQSSIHRQRLWGDIGIGFGKTLAHNRELLRHIALFHGLGIPLLLGASRKRFIGDIDRQSPANKRQAGSITATLHGAYSGCHMIRVHDVYETRQALALWHAIHT